MEIKDILNRFELLNKNDSTFSDLRRAYVDKDLYSIFRLVNTDSDNLKKLVLEDNIWALWKLLEQYSSSQFVAAFKSFYINKIEINNDCFSQGQLLSKQWIIDKLKDLDLNLGTVFLCAGWYATLATMIFESKINVDKIRSFDIDESCISIAETFNKPWVLDNWKFKSSLKNILDLKYSVDKYSVKRSDGTVVELEDMPDTIINTSCEHIENFSNWYNLIPEGKLLILQTNNYFEIPDHVNCSKDLEEFSNQTPMTKVLYQGELELPKYKRFMRIGYK